MAYYVRLWLRAQARRCLHVSSGFHSALSLGCVEHRRMKNWIAVPILVTLTLVVSYSAFSCSNSPTLGNDAHVSQQHQEVERNMASNSQNDCSNAKAVFSVTNMSSLFQKCAKSGKASQVEMDLYLDAWEELIRFLNSMGKAFTFVSSDVIEKVGILRDFRASEQGENYATIEQMMSYEKEHKIINYKEAPSKKVKASGSRTLLRLHRALKFLLILIGKLARNEDNGKVSVMGYNAYHASPMSKYHPWIVQKAVGVAVYILPDRETFIKQMCQDLTMDEIASTMDVCSSSMDAVFEYSEALYSKYDLLEIP